MKVIFVLSIGGFEYGIKEWYAKMDLEMAQLFLELSGSVAFEIGESMMLFKINGFVYNGVPKRRGSMFATIDFEDQKIYSDNKRYLNLAHDIENDKNWVKLK